jgi:formate-dependent nitrite reductase membrane component NrfD
MIDVPSSTWFTVSPHWQWLIVFYFFLGGLAGGSYFLAALIDLFGRAEDRPLARFGYYIAFPCVVASGILLIFDLSRPARFWHLLIESNTMFPMFKYWAPMSIGSWALLAFGFFSLLSFLGALAESGRGWRGAIRMRPPGMLGAVIAVIGALFGLYIAGYTGVLLAVTNRPIWSDTPLIGMLLIVSATSISAALLVLLGRAMRRTPPGVFALHRLDGWVIPLEFLVLLAVVLSLGSVASAWLNGWGLLLLIGVVLVGMVIPFTLHRRREWASGPGMSVAALLVLVGGFVLRVVIVMSPGEIQV